MSKYAETGIWKSAMAASGDESLDQQIERLRAAYHLFCRNACLLSQQIQRDVQNLTLHDENHFEALWRRADQIAGSNLELTPLEVFVFGGAILLHDNANSIAAFGGMEEIEASAEWQDGVAEELNGELSATAGIDEKTRASVLFNVLRQLHAEKAKSLASLSVTIGHEKHYLISDDQLRAHLGDLMGQIAASHHWDANQLSNRLPSIRGPLAGMPDEWSVRPLLLACLLRCSDAAQLDQSRTPDFLYGLLKLEGLSESHWRAQNRLTAPVIKKNDPSALIFTSTIPFGPGDAAAWWIVYDAIQVVAKEIQYSNQLLRDHGLPSFAITRVDGSTSPSQLSKHIGVLGWRPVEAAIKISSPINLVELFGGEKIYGRDFSAALRELIQNAADAINMRRSIEPKGSMYQGGVSISLEPCADSSGDQWLTVADDGIGMSEGVITGALIDFGHSYMSSSLVKWERPGLLAKSKSKRRIGRFGIGFFASFMLAEEVMAVSKPFDEGKNCFKTLHFSKGLKHRPTLLEGTPSDVDGLLSTQIKLRLTVERLKELMKKGKDDLDCFTLESLVGFLCPTLDVNVYVVQDGELKNVHSHEWHVGDRAAWLKRILGYSRNVQSVRENDIDYAAKMLDFIDEAKPYLGLAAISKCAALGVPTIGTLRAGRRFGQSNDDFAGAIDYDPAGPDRVILQIKDKSALAAWASRQAMKYSDCNLTPVERALVAARIARFGGDCSSVLVVKINRSWADISEVYSYLKNNGPLLAPIKAMIGEEWRITQVREKHWGFIDHYEDDELDLVEGVMEAPSDDEVFSFFSEKNKGDQSFVKLLGDYCLSRGDRLIVEGKANVEFGCYIGLESPRQGLFKGKLVKSNALEFTLEEKVN